MAKSPDAFRTISEVAEWLGIQAHVLRFWESKFTQVKPIKRAGGRRYYRPSDMLLLGGIKQLLHEDGLTIKGVQKILREEGMSHVAGMSAPLDDLTLSQLGEDKPKTPPHTAVKTPEDEKGVVLSFDGGTESKSDKNVLQDVEIMQELTKIPDAEMADDESEVAVDAAPDDSAEPQQPQVQENEIEASEPAQESAEEPPLLEPEEATDPEPLDATPEDEPALEDASEPASVDALPAFLRHPLTDQDGQDEKPVVAAQPDAEPQVETPRKPRVIDLPAFATEADFDAVPAALTAAFRAREIAPENRKKASTLLRQLTALRDSMATRPRPSPPPSNQD
ncbi:MerR family transcriptional regulator [Sulfitobacter sp. MF3-043]|uniref:MerR family transcriptional regulator n=1 Tax=Sulfitobacter sediminivivens TaxID=3252902 RepID=UPI0036DF4EA6